MPKPSTKHPSPTSARRLNSHPRSWWQDHYQAWQASDLSKSAYCVRQGLNVSSFSNWTTRFARESAKQAASARNVFFKAQTQAAQPVFGRISTLNFHGLALTFEEPINPESLPAWIQVLKTC
jgi:hypothetical protein